MTKCFSFLIYWGCNLTISIVPVFALYFLWDMNSFASLARNSLNLAIQWNSVESWQWYLLWLLTTVYISIGLVGVYFLRRPFHNFAKGELFNLTNSVHFKRFSTLLFLQAIAAPLNFSLSSILLSLNHPKGQKLLAVSFGSDEIKAIVLGMIFLVVSNLLVEAASIHTENKQFV